MTTLTASALRTGLAVLDAALLAGVKTVVIGDETIVYQDAGEMLKARNLYAQQLQTLEGAPRIQRTMAVFCDE